MNKFKSRKYYIHDSIIPQKTQSVKFFDIMLPSRKNIGVCSRSLSTLQWTSTTTNKI